MSTNHPFTYEEFKEIYSKVPRLCIDVLIQSEEGILLTRRSLDFWKGYWHTPGGTVFYKETLHDAVKRVAKSEVHVDVEIEKFVGYMEFPSEEKVRGFGWSVSLVFLCRIKSGTPSPDEQADKIGFFKVIPENTIPEQSVFLRNFLKHS